MGTRADFYIGRGLKAKWLGSIAYDGYPTGWPKRVLNRRSVKTFKSALRDVLKQSGSTTYPKDGWPWPWEDSRTTDYAYAFEDGQVWVSYFGSEWFTVERGVEPDYDTLRDKVAVFPDMSAKRNLAPLGSPQSGALLLFGVSK